MKPQLIIKSYLLGMFLFIAGIAKATNYYVDPSSTASTQNGALATPWRTLSQVQSAMNSFVAGDFIYFKRGETFSGSLNITKNGTAAAPITFATYGSSSALPVFTSTTADDLFTCNNRSYIVFDGFKITDPTLDPNDRNQQANILRAFELDGCTYVTVKNCDISLVGVGINMVSNYCTMDHNTIGNLRMIRNTPGGDDDYGANPVVISGSNNNVTSNYFKDCWAYSYDYTYDGGAIEVYGAGNNGNKIMYNTAVNCDGFMEIGYNGGGTSDNNMVAYNKIVNCGELVYISNSGTYATTVNNLQFFNNVIVHTVNQLTMPTSMIGMSASSSTANIVNLKNNIFWLTTGIDVARSGKFSGSQLTHEDNIYHLGTGSILNFTIGSTEMTTSAVLFTNTNPSDPTTWDYAPPTGSPAIDFGQNLGITKDFAGNTVPAVPNAGILESGSAAAPLAASSSAGSISCNGGTTTVTVTATGGTAPYTGTGSFTNVAAGPRTYTVTDAAGGTASTTITISQPAVLAATLSAGTIPVFGGTTTVTASASGGTAPYTYKLNSGSYQSSNTFTGVLAGTHTVTVKDANGCTTSGLTITITQPAALQLAAASTAGTISCNGGSVTVTVTATGGVAPYTGTGNFTVTAGTYTYSVSDASGATATTAITVSEPSAIAVTLSAGTIAINGGTTTLTASATGGTGAYSYKLNSGSYQSSNTFSNVAAGTHAVTVKDANGCTRVKNITITEPQQLGASSTSGTIGCNGGTTTVTVSATGGVTPYSGTGTFSVTAGTYNYTVTDANGATATSSISVSQPASITVTLSSGTIAVFGGTTTLTASATGGTGAYTYKLNSGAYQASNTFTNVTAGTHSVTVKDANGCTSAQTITITQPEAPAQLLASSASAPISCNGGTTTVTVSATGGTTPYSGTGSFTVSAGTYSYTVTDATGTTATTSITVSQPSAISVSIAAGSIAVFGGTTTVDVNANGGTASYAYKLNSGSYQASNTFTGVAAGSHAVTVKDANGCTSVKNFTLTQPPAPVQLVATANAGTISCNGGTATVTVSASGGVAPYTGTGDFIVSAGTYSYTVTDASGATATTAVTVNQPTLITVTLSSGTIAVFGGTTTLTAAANGGTGAYTYKLNSDSYQSSNTFPNVGAGTHTVTVKDANGCTSVQTITITQPVQNTMIVTATATPIICNASISTITVSASGGTAPYTGTGYYTGYAGTYTYTVTDANGASTSTTLTITQPAAIALSVNAPAIPRAGGTTTVTVNATGGSGNYTYSFNGSLYQASNTFANVLAGVYNVNVKDANGCIATTSITLVDPASGNFRINLVSKTNTTCRGSRTGSIEVIALNGRAPYQYKINNGRYSSSNLFKNLATGIYRVSAKDANGNVVSLVTFILDSRTICSRNGVEGAALNITAFPNPTADRFSLSIQSVNDADVLVEVMNLNGRKVFEGRGSVYRNYVFGDNFTPGTYFVRVTQGNDVKTTTLIKGK
ncbi:MAG: T9SS type A sorting domain-containing protein [Ferruginibacter sp.]